MWPPVCFYSALQVLTHFSSLPHLSTFSFSQPHTPIPKWSQQTVKKGPVVPFTPLRLTPTNLPEYAYMQATPCNANNHVHIHLGSHVRHVWMK